MAILEILKKYDIHPVKRFGQNFLTDPNIKRKIVESLPLGESKPFVEIGPGLGVITEALLEKGEHVISIEIDKKLQAYLENELTPRYPKNFELVKGDALEELGKVLRHRPVPSILVGNLPYYISSPLLFRALEFDDLIEAAFFTLQKEVVARLVAKPGTGEYGRLSASFGYFAYVKRLFDISPSCFRPKPDVQSAFIRIEFKKKFKDTRLKGEYLELVKAAFSERRKQLVNLITRHYGLKNREAEDCMIRLGLSPEIRAEKVSPPEFWKLLDFIHRHKSKV